MTSSSRSRTARAEIPPAVRARAMLELRRRERERAEERERESIDPHAEERARCHASVLYFILTFVWILDGMRWARFLLWEAQREALALIDEHRQVVILKARQLGLTWLCLAYALWLMLYRPIATVLLFSLRDDEAMVLLDRLKQMYGRLPGWMRRQVVTDSRHVFELANGSTARAFPTSAGDSYTATFALVDEADLVPDLAQLLERVKPTVDAGGKLVLLSRVDKKAPVSTFKQIYKAAKQGLTKWSPLFIPWYAHPKRTEDWYQQECADSVANTGSLDFVHGQYPAQDIDALAPASLDKRFPATWLEACYEEGKPIEPKGAPAVPELVIYAVPIPGRRYVIGADPAEGLPAGDDSAATVLDRDSGEEVARLVGKLEPKRVFPEALAHTARYFNGADLLVEKNNHGHAVIAKLEELKCSVLDGRDGKPGWVTSILGKTLMADTAADALKNGETVIRSFSAHMQLASIERATLSAPKGMKDDEAVAYALALVARSIQPQKPPAPAVLAGRRPQAQPTRVF
jgi:hypothetical protein